MYFYLFIFSSSGGVSSTAETIGVRTNRDSTSVKKSLDIKSSSSSEKPKSMIKLF